MTTEVLTQLRTLRESIAEALKKDPRYLTLAALDKSIAEIGDVLKTAGIDVAHAPAPGALQFETPAAGHAPEAQNSGPTTLGRKRPTLTPLVGGAALGLTTPSVEPPQEASTAETTPEPETRTEAVDHDQHAVAAAHESEPEEDLMPPVDFEPGPKRTAHDPIGHVESVAEEPAPHAVLEDVEPDHLAGQTVVDEHPAHESSPVDADDVSVPRKASGYTPMAAKPGATQYQPAMSVKFGRLPNKVDLRPLMPPVEDQGDTSSCVANAVAGAYEYWIKKASKQNHEISRLFVYYNARWRDGTQDRDDGSAIQFAMEGLSKFGACSDMLWPFDQQLVAHRPGAEAYQDAASYKVHDMAQVPLRLEAWKQAIAEGKPIVFGCLLFDSFDDCTHRGGVVSMPAPDDLARATHSGHAMCAVGYCDTEKVFIVRNSWGEQWGDKGYCYMPYAYLMNPKLNDGDSWVFIPKVPSQPPREVWSDDARPVTNGGAGVAFPIEDYDVADYEHVGVDLFESVRKPFNNVVDQEFATYVTLASKGLWDEMQGAHPQASPNRAIGAAGMAAVASAFGFDDPDDAPQEHAETHRA